MAKDYAAIAASKIRKPSQSKRKPNFLIYARNKKGKTHFGSSAPNVLMLEIDPGGTDEERKLDPDTWPLEKWEDTDDVWRFLKGSKEAEKYDWVCADGMTRLANVALRWVMRQEEERDLDRRPNQVGKQDYGRAGEMVKGFIHNFIALPQAVIFTANERTIELDEDGDEVDGDAETASTMFVPDLPKGARGSMNAAVDVIGRLYVVNVEKNVRLKSGDIETRTLPERRLWVSPHPKYDTGYRSGFRLPDYLENPTPTRLVELMRNGKVTANG